MFSPQRAYHLRKPLNNRHGLYRHQSEVRKICLYLIPHPRVVCEVPLPPVHYLHPLSSFYEKLSHFSLLLSTRIKIKIHSADHQCSLRINSVVAHILVQLPSFMQHVLFPPLLATTDPSLPFSLLFVAHSIIS